MHPRDQMLVLALMLVIVGCVVCQLSLYARMKHHGRLPAPVYAEP